MDDAFSLLTFKTDIHMQEIDAISLQSLYGFIT